MPALALFRTGCIERPMLAERLFPSAAGLRERGLRGLTTAPAGRSEREKPSAPRTRQLVFFATFFWRSKRRLVSLNGKYYRRLKVRIKNLSGLTFAGEVLQNKKIYT